MNSTALEVFDLLKDHCRELLLLELPKDECDSHDTDFYVSGITLDTCESLVRSHWRLTGRRSSSFRKRHVLCLFLEGSTGHEFLQVDFVDQIRWRTFLLTPRAWDSCGTRPFKIDPFTKAVVLQLLSMNKRKFFHNANRLINSTDPGNLHLEIHRSLTTLFFKEASTQTTESLVAAINSGGCAASFESARLQVLENLSASGAKGRAALRDSIWSALQNRFGRQTMPFFIIESDDPNGCRTSIEEAFRDSHRLFPYCRHHHVLFARELLSFSSLGNLWYGLKNWEAVTVIQKRSLFSSLLRLPFGIIFKNCVVLDHHFDIADWMNTWKRELYRIFRVSDA